MLKELTQEQFLNFSRTGKPVVLFKEIGADYLTPISTFQALSKPGDGSILLESAEKDPERGKLSLLALNPQMIFQAKGLRYEIQEGEKKIAGSGDPMEKLRELLDQKRPANPEALTALVGGAVGFLSYDAVRLFENIPDRHHHDPDIPDLFFQFPALAIVFDHEQNKICFALNVEIGTDPLKDYHRATQELEKFIQQALAFKPEERTNRLSQFDSFKTDLEDACFYEKIRQAKEHILDGDAFQIVLSRTFEKKTSLTGIEIYRALRYTSPAPFMFYLETPHFTVAGASPERLVSLKEGQIETIPIAGTRLRGTAEEDRLREQELLNDEKELAEHMMLVDLARNDIGRVAEPGSVVVKELKVVRHFSHVMHIISRVQGRLARGKDAIDLLKATFPAGTLTGAPKIRAMEIIDHLETSRRGLYGGAFCLLDTLGNLDSCIIIRTLVLRKNVVKVRAGAGIVFDSTAPSEAQETRDKAKGVMCALENAEKGGE